MLRLQVVPISKMGMPGAEAHALAGSGYANLMRPCSERRLIMVVSQSRAFAGEPDIVAITQFLLQTYAINQSLHNWEPRRWQGMIYHRNDADSACYRARLPDLVRIWQDETGAIVGAVIPEYEGSAFLQIHPQYRFLESEMLDWAQSHLAQTNDAGRQWLDVWAYATDQFRADLLRQRGYIQTDVYENRRRRLMTIPIPEIVIPKGYRVRTMRRHADDWQAQAILLNAAFERTIHSAQEYSNFQSAPDYRLDLDIVVEAPDGTLAATAGFTPYEAESFAILEPVCTHPEHQGLGLARAAIAEGLRRVHDMGIRITYVTAWHSNLVANHTYEKMGFTESSAHYLWRLTW
jgi:ribosomal protein S18 acetylase RimI-like enzyme